ncbi:ergothioneine biosynthesis protein EgtB [Kangiella sediminilitoris]|uniref:Ergothioneine biosynthesis protein EgtB n=1 Tax=Kangiella sediminilitoris TaxID=1144748 RepID=A0A1B3BB73_9GAMM|nr:ergothioneine biosynthesis protein EgtB [Kangiella sediminilitoris]AOE50042.1 hypothetical protein KS2013_1328 [Kangiella sediminilitoris]
MLEEIESNASLLNHEARFIRVRELTEVLCENLAVEDYGLQAVAETSPAKWHLAHTSWFFETFILCKYAADYKAYDSQFEFLFNSYYNAVGEQYPRAKRHLLSRPTVEEVFEYRKLVTDSISQLLNSATEDLLKKVIPLVELGIHHEQQHQELLLTDLKYNLFQNPMFPAYCATRSEAHFDGISSSPAQWSQFDSGLVTIGVNNLAGSSTFSFDNECPKHQVYLNSYELSNRLVTNGEYIEFIESGGYQQPKLWLSDGWDARKKNGWAAPLYWFKREGRWYHYTLLGIKPVNLSSPLCHISYYEADAYATWKSSRLPTEEEWEHAALQVSGSGNFLHTEHLEPIPVHSEIGIQQLFGDVWEWTQSSYRPYPGFKPLEGAVGEYNGKFMANQFVLRGGSCVTSQDHIRATYRNFFYPDARWQFSGFRLARDL